MNIIKSCGVGISFALAILGSIPAAAQGDTELAVWNFNYKYDIADGIGTPNATAVTGSNDNTELAGVRLVPNSKTQAEADYYIKAVRPANSDENAMQSAVAVFLETKGISADGAALHITNPLPTSQTTSTAYNWGETEMTYPDGASASYQQPYNYFELELNTKGYKNVGITVKAAGHQSKTQYYAVATSTDGSTWTIVGDEYLAGTSYKTWNTLSIDLANAIDNMEKAYVRIFPADDWTAKNASNPFKDNQFDIDNLIVYGDEDIQIDPSQFLPTSVTIDGVKNADALKSLLADGNKATIEGLTFTQVPTLAVVMSTGKAADVSEPTISGSTYTYTVTAAYDNQQWTGTIVVEGVHIYTIADTDKKHSIAPGTGTATDGVWSDGTVSTNFTGDWAFKLGSGSYSINVPTNWKLKEVVFRQSSDNYSSEGSVSAASSDGAIVYVNYDTQLIQGTEREFYFPIGNHVAGTPFNFTLSNCGQATLKSIDIIYEEVAATTAPELLSVSTTPTEHANHCVATLTFSHAVASAAANIGDNNNNVEAEGLGTTQLRFSLWDLDYDKTTSLVIPEGKLADDYGNSNAKDIVVDITVGKKAEVTKAEYDYVVATTDELRSAVETTNGSNKSSDAVRKTIFVLNGDYNLGSEELSLTSSNVSIVGESRDGVLIHGLRDGISNPVVSLKKATATHLENLTLRNDLNWAADDKGGVAVALTAGKKTSCRNVTLQSNQDTFVSGESGYFSGCDIHGTVDFICGGGEFFFEGCKLILEDRNGNVVVAPNHNASARYGYVFSNCTIKAADGATQVTDGSYNLGRPWQNSPRAAFIGTRMEVLPTAAGWTGMSSNLETHFYEYGSVDAQGNTIDLSTRNVEACNSSNGNYTPVLTDAESKAYTLRNVTGGNDSWEAADAVESVVVPSLTMTEKTLSWTAADNARCYVVIKNGAYLANTSATSLTVDAAVGDKFAVKAVNAYGGLGETSNIVEYANATGVTTVKTVQEGTDSHIYSINGKRMQSVGDANVYIYNGKKYINSSK